MNRRLLLPAIVAAMLAFPSVVQAAKPQLLTVPPLTTNSQTQTFEFTIANPNYFLCSLDGSAFAFCSSPISFSQLAEGSHSFSVRANHNVPDCPLNCGNLIPVTSDVSTFAFTIDRTKPTVAFTSGPKQGSATKSRTAMIAFASEAGSSYICTFDKRTPEPCESTVEWRNIEPGLHRVKVRAIDPAGNEGENFSLEFAVNTRTVTYRSIAKTTAKRCVKRKFKRRGRIVRTKSGKIRYRTTCKRVRF